jgi:hypothetical protein
LPLSFPRSSDRGLIEAINGSGGKSAVNLDFRDHLIAASLKPSGLVPVLLISAESFQSRAEVVLQPAIAAI